MSVKVELVSIVMDVPGTGRVSCLFSVPHLVMVGPHVETFCYLISQNVTDDIG
jgi:hypothetical protein